MAIQKIELGTEPTGSGGDTNRSAMKKINDNFGTVENAASRIVGTAAGNLMEVGAFGLGTALINRYTDALNRDDLTTGFYGGQFADKPANISDWATAIHVSNGSAGNSHYSQLLMDIRSPNLYYRARQGGIFTPWCLIYNSGNTTKDTSNGYLKGSSPIVKLYFDRIELNDDAKKQNITFEKLGIGDYLIKGSLGFAQEGWYIETPRDANGNVLVAVIYTTLDNGDISVKTYAKKLDPETGDVIANLAKPVDIPPTRWIDLRLHEIKTELTPVE